MGVNVRKLSIPGVYADSLRILGQGFPLFFWLAAAAAAIVAGSGTLVAVVNWGVSATRTGIDPRVLAVTTTPRQFAVIGVGVLVAALALSYAAAAAIHATAEIAAGRSIGFKEAIRRVPGKGMQLFWLQWVVNILGARFSPFAAIALWLLIAPAIPMAVLHARGPVEAAEIAFDRLKGNRLRMLGLEVLLLAPIVILPFGLAVVMLPGGVLDVAGVPPLLTLALALPGATVVMLPVMLMLIALTLADQRLSVPI